MLYFPFSETTPNSKQEWLFESDGVTVKSTDFFSFIRRKFESGGKGFYGWNDLRYFLYEYEEGLKNGLGQQKQNGRGQQKFGWSNFVRHEKDRVSIEHIYPQTATDDYWQIRFSGLSDIQIRQLQGSLGNLLPLSSSINSSLQNVSFPEKKSSGGGRNGYSNGSYSELEVAQYLDWTPNDILERGIKLLRFMETRWNIRLGDREDLVALLHLAFLDEKPTVADQQNALQ